MVSTIVKEFALPITIAIFGAWFMADLQKEARQFGELEQRNAELKAQIANIATQHGEAYKRWHIQLKANEQAAAAQQQTAQAIQTELVELEAQLAEARERETDYFNTVHPDSVGRLLNTAAAARNDNAGRISTDNPAPVTANSVQPSALSRDN